MAERGIAEAPLPISTGRVHVLKIEGPFYADVISGRKRFEARSDDRHFQIGDVLRLREWTADRWQYTGRCVDVRVVYILSGERFGIQYGYVVMGIEVDWQTMLAEPAEEGDRG